MHTGVAALSAQLQLLMDDWKLDSVAATKRLPDGHLITLRYTGPILSIERDDGVVVLVTATEDKCDG
jgi:hypothetical protein